MTQTQEPTEQTTKHPASKILRPYVDGDDNLIGYLIYCPGCKSPHSLLTVQHRKDGTRNPQWTFNGDVEKPTFEPSLLCYWNDPEDNRCHSSIRNGRIEFLDDCFHELAGQTVDLPPYQW